MQNRLKRVGFVFCFPKNSIFANTNAGIAQLVEHQLPKLRVASSSLVTRSKGTCKAGAFFMSGQRE